MEINLGLSFKVEFGKGQFHTSLTTLITFSVKSFEFHAKVNKYNGLLHGFLVVEIRASA